MCTLPGNTRGFQEDVWEPVGAHGLYAHYSRLSYGRSCEQDANRPFGGVRRSSMAAGYSCCIFCVKVWIPGIVVYC